MPRDVVEKLFLRTADGIKPGLEVETALIKQLGHPDQAYRTIHVAGTNGKGSVCAMVASMLSEAGLKTGLYISPHLVSFNERFQIDGVCIADEALVDLIQEVENADAALVRGHLVSRPATFFECSTAMAMLYFQQQQVDVAVIETGMGGIWDATNIIQPVVSVITHISLDHANYLGSSLVAIATEKCGIIKSDTPVVCSLMVPEIMDVLEATAARQQARICRADTSVTLQVSAADTDSGQTIVAAIDDVVIGEVHLPLRGAHQLMNTKLAMAAVQVFAEITGCPLNREAVCEGLRKVEWPGRCQQISTHPPVFLDGAHNPAGMESAMAFIRTFDRPVGLVFGVLNDKDVDGMVRAFCDDLAYCWAVPIESARALSPDQTGEYLQRHHVLFEVCSLEDGIKLAIQWAVDQEGVVLVAGSLYLMGEVLAGGTWQLSRD